MVMREREREREREDRRLENCLIMRRERERNRRERAWHGVRSLKVRRCLRETGRWRPLCRVVSYRQFLFESRV